MATDFEMSSTSIDPAKFDSLSMPAYEGFRDYPDTVTIGDTLFPLLYIYYMGNESDRSRVGNTYKFDQAMKEYIANLSAVAGTGGTDTSSLTMKLMGKNTGSSVYVGTRKFRLMFDTVCEKNPQFVWMVANAAATAMKKYASRISYNTDRPLPGQTYYRQEVPNKKNPTKTETQFSSLPQINGNTGASISTSMEAFRILFENNLISSDYNLGIRPIDLFTGQLAQERTDIVRDNVGAKYIGLPTRGIFTVSKTKKGATMYHTFSGIDITAIASLSTTVSQLDQLLSVSWSIHRGSTSNRTLGKPSAGGRVRGGRTVAGTMIFALTDHHPLRDIIPDTWKGRQTQILNDPDTWKPLVLADEIPPFDLVLTLTNEYGFASITTLYGVQIADEGGVLGMDNLITEMVLQYTAVEMDPIMEAKLDDNGVIDPYSILQGGYSKMWKKRELVSTGAAFSDLEAAYERYYDSAMFVPRKR